MIKKYLILLILATTLLLGSLKIGLSQNNDDEYPKLFITQDGDTLLLLTIPQIKKLNILYLEKQKYKELTDSLNKQVSDYELVIIQDKELINNLKDQLILNGNIINEKDGIITNLKEENKKQDKKLNRQGFLNKALIIGVLILGVLVLV